MRSRERHGNVYSLASMLVCIRDSSASTRVGVYLPFVSVCFIYCVKSVLYQREHMLFILLGLAYFTEYDGLQLDPLFCKWKDLIFFYGHPLLVHFS